MYFVPLDLLEQFLNSIKTILIALGLNISVFPTPPPTNTKMGVTTMTLWGAGLLIFHWLRILGLLLAPKAQVKAFKGTNQTKTETCGYNPPFPLHIYLSTPPPPRLPLHVFLSSSSCLLLPIFNLASSLCFQDG